MPAVVPDMTTTPIAIADSPVGILWNGPFAVTIFFVLSGFVMSAAAERRHDLLVSNVVTRYLRLAVPVVVSVMFAWIMLSLFPTAAWQLRDATDEPSRWLAYTYQGDIPSFPYAIFDGLVNNFVSGKSNFNNVLWTMKIELIGSVGLFGLYWISEGRARIIMLCLAGLALALLIRPQYLAFILGSLTYEAHVRDRIRPIGRAIPWIALAVGVLLGAAGRGTAERWGLPDLPWYLTIGIPGSFSAVLAATLILFSVIALPTVGRFFSIAPIRWLGRISFALYLVHVPLLYTLIASAAVRISVPYIVLFFGYLFLTFALAYILTVAVDEPTLRQLKRIRQYVHRADNLFRISRASNAGRN